MSQQINLFNPVFMKQRKYFSLLAMLQALGLIVLGSLFIFAYALYQVAQLTHQSEESAKRFDAEQARFTRNAAEFSPQRANQLLQNEVSKLEKDLEAKTHMADTLKSGALGNTTGYSVYMRAFARRVVPGLWLTSFKVSGGDEAQISLSGGVVNPELLPIYIQRLSKEAAMRGKTFATLQMQQPDAGIQNSQRPKNDETAAKNAAPKARYVEFTLQSSTDSGTSAKDSGARK